MHTLLFFFTQTYIPTCIHLNSIHTHHITTTIIIIIIIITTTHQVRV